MSPGKNWHLQLHHSYGSVIFEFGGNFEINVKYLSICRNTSPEAEALLPALIHTQAYYARMVDTTEVLVQHNTKRENLIPCQNEDV